jgi:glyoxylase-like metal-dependent hydrolase (beta-lactamase superfamily II)
VTSAPTTGPGSTATLPDLAAVPPAALGPTLNDQGFYVGPVERNLYWVTDGVYVSAFLTTPDGVVLFDAPATIGHNLQRTVDQIATENGVSNQVTHLAYSHHHADHLGAAALFGDDVVRIGHAETRRLLVDYADPTRPAPDVTFEDRYTLHIGGERVELAWQGTNHAADNIFIHLPDHDTLMLVDVVLPGWVPIYDVNVATDIPGLPGGPRHRPVLPLAALHRRAPGQARHPRRRRHPPAVLRRHGREHPNGLGHRRPDAVLHEVRREHLGCSEDLHRPRDRAGRRARDREVHRGAGRRRRLHHQ